MMVSIHLVTCLLPIAPSQLFLSHTTMLNDVETKYNCSDRNYVDLKNIRDERLIIFKCVRHALGKSTFRELSPEEWAQAHLYVLTNSEDVIPFFE